MHFCLPSPSSTWCPWLRASWAGCVSSTSSSSWWDDCPKITTGLFLRGRFDSRRSAGVIYTIYRDTLWGRPVLETFFKYDSLNCQSGHLLFFFVTDRGQHRLHRALAPQRTACHVERQTSAATPAVKNLHICWDVTSLLFISDSTAGLLRISSC